MTKSFECVPVVTHIIVAPKGIFLFNYHKETSVKLWTGHPELQVITDTIFQCSSPITHESEMRYELFCVVFFSRSNYDILLTTNLSEQTDKKVCNCSILAT